MIKPLQSLIERRRGRVATLAWVLGLVVIPTALRWALNPVLGDSVRFVTYFPAVLAAGLLLDWRLAAVVLGIDAVVATLVALPVTDLDLISMEFLAGVAVYLVSSGLIVVTAAVLRLTLGQLARAGRTERALNAELRHRVKNTLAIVQSFAFQASRSTDPDPKNFYPAFFNRLDALARAHDLLVAADWGELGIHDVAGKVLEPFRSAAPERFSVSGEPCHLPADACVPLCLALHELATNAIKYGALSQEGGQVELSWTRAGTAAAPLLRLRWAEQGGPQVAQPARRGLGTRLLERQNAFAEVDMRFEPAGVVCEIAVRLAEPSGRAARHFDPTAAPLPQRAAAS